MQISSRMTIAVHIITCIDYFGEQQKVTSDFLAGSVGVNPVIVRNILSMLRNAGIIYTKRGSGGATLARPLSEITLYDVYLAVDSVGEGGLFHFHETPNPECPVGRNIRAAVDGHLSDAQRAMEAELLRVTLREIAEETRERIEREA